MKNFILGLGHQKCGTSWLHSYMSQSEFFASGYAKEYQIWNRIDIPIFQYKLANFSFGKILSPKRFRAYRMEKTEKFYFDYFENLLTSDKNFTADITPCYSGLKSSRLKRIQSAFKSRGIETKVVILVRDPLSRIKSAVRFNLDRLDYSEGISKGETDFNKALLEYYRSDFCILHTNYQNIITEASKVFPSENVYIGFYENMFSEREISRLSNFIGIEPKFEYSKVFVNKTIGSIEETNSDIVIKEFYSDTYDFFHNNYPITKELWV